MNYPNMFPALYKCKIEETGQLLYKIKPTIWDLSQPLPPPMIDDSSYTSEKEIAIKMPESEYQRFLQNWNQYMTIMSAAQANPMVRDQYHSLLTFATLIK